MWTNMIHEFCPMCDGDVVSSTKPTLWERVRYWLWYGSALSPTLTCSNGHEWNVGGRGTFSLVRRRGPQWLRIPWLVFRAVHESRSMEPVPLTYVMAVLVGAVVGVVANVVLGWMWWLVAGVFVVSVWLFFMASAFWGPGSSIADDVWRAVNPERAVARSNERLERAVREDWLRAYGVEGWDGSRWLGGWGGSPEPDTVTLRHGGPDAPTWIEVVTSTKHEAIRLGTSKGEDPIWEWRDQHFKHRLLWTDEDPPEDLDMVERHRWLLRRSREIDAQQLPGWEPEIVLVNDVPTAFECINVGKRWAAIAVIDDITVEIVAQGLPHSQVALVAQQTLEPYFQGLRDLNDQRRREHGH